MELAYFTCVFFWVRPFFGTKVKLICVGQISSSQFSKMVMGGWAFMSHEHILFTLCCECAFKLNFLHLIGEITLWKKEKMLATISFYFFHNIFKSFFLGLLKAGFCGKGLTVTKLSVEMRSSKPQKLPLTPCMSWQPATLLYNLMMKWSEIL